MQRNGMTNDGVGVVGANDDPIVVISDNNLNRHLLFQGTVIEGRDVANN